MENRFGFKDLILVVLLVALLISVWLAMKQSDRQWRELREIRESMASQAKDLHALQTSLSSGAFAVNTGTTRPATTQTGDPFARIRAAKAMPDFAPGGTLVDAFGGTTAKLTPLLSVDAYASLVQGYVLESLATRDPDTLEWQPLLATSWKITDNSAAHDAAVAELEKAGKSAEEIAKDETVPPSTKITFKMRPGVRFSDGTPLTADDVVFTYQFTMDEKINAPRDKAYLSRITSVVKSGEDEVTFTLKEPYFESFELCAGIGVLPKHFYSQFTPEDFNNSVGYLMGSGPYRMPDPKSWRPGTLVEVVRNERYWGVTGAFDRMVWREITNDTARLAAFRNGDTDLFPCYPEQYASMIKDASLVERTQHFEYQNPVGGYRYVGWNQKRNGQPTVFADVRVRQAMTMLLDRKRMIEQIMLGYAVEASGPFNPLSKQFNPEVKPWPYDTKAAMDLLKQAGFQDRDGVLHDANGRPFRFKLTYISGNPNYEKQALFMKDAYARAGIIMDLDPLDWAILLERVKNKDYDAITLAWSAGIESDIYQMFHSSQAIADGDNASSYISPRLDKLIDAARRSLDEEKRMKLWRQAHQVLHEEQPYTFLFFPKSLVFIDGRVKNVQQVKLGLNPRDEWFVPAAQQRSTR